MNRPYTKYDYRKLAKDTAHKLEQYYYQCCDKYWDLRDSKNIDAAFDAYERKEILYKAVKQLEAVAKNLSEK